MPLREVLVPMKKSFTDSSTVHKLLPVVLPHELFPVLMKHQPLCVDLEDRVEYWNHCIQHMVWCTDPSEAIADAQHFRVPVYLYGDDTRFSQAEKLGVVMVGGVLDTRKSSMETHFPLFVIRDET